MTKYIGYINVERRMNYQDEDEYSSEEYDVYPDNSKDYHYNFNPIAEIIEEGCLHSVHIYENKERDELFKGSKKISYKDILVDKKESIEEKCEKRLFVLECNEEDIKKGDVYGSKKQKSIFDSKIYYAVSQEDFEKKPDENSIIISNEELNYIMARDLVFIELERDCWCGPFTVEDDEKTIKMSQMCVKNYYESNNINKIIKIKKQCKKGKEFGPWKLFVLEDTQTKDDIRIMGNTIGLNTILYGPPGTGKTYNAVKYAVGIIEPKKRGIIEKSEVDANAYKEIKKAYDDYVNKGKIKFVTFHQSYGYEEFIEGIKPVLPKIEDKQMANGSSVDIGSSVEEKNNKLQKNTKENDNVGNLNYQIEDGIFKRFCQQAKNDPNPQNNRYVFIIDEINRGNISKIFGELITLIEPNKRDGKDEAMKLILPYSQEEFSVPKNVYILGTMNTADRSIALIDTALRRRFNFIEMMPKLELLKDIDVEGINIKKMLKTINRRIEILYDREHTIGHAFFMELKDNPNMNVLADIFKTNIIPLLQEYFFENYEKIQWILGDNSDKKNKFIEAKSIEYGKEFFGPIENDKEKFFLINNKAFEESESYIGIYEKK